MAYFSKTGVLFAIGLAILPLGISAEAVEKTQSRPAIRQHGMSTVLETGPRFFTIRQLLAKQRGELVPTARAPRGAETASMDDTVVDDALASRMRAPFASRGFEMFASTNEAIAAQWQSVRDEWRAEHRLVERCAENGGCSRSSNILVSIARQASNLEGMEQLALVNARVNAAVRYRSDISQHGVADHWSPPLQTLGQAGDCEDYVIAKFYILRHIGIAERNLRIVLVKDRRAREDHAVLAVKGAYGWHLLDNRSNAIESDVNMPHYRPVIALNTERMEMFAAPYVELDDLDLKGEILPASARSTEADELPVLRGVAK